MPGLQDDKLTEKKKQKQTTLVRADIARIGSEAWGMLLMGELHFGHSNKSTLGTPDLAGHLPPGSPEPKPHSPGDFGKRWMWTCTETGLKWAKRKGLSPFLLSPFHLQPIRFLESYQEVFNLLPHSIFLSSHSKCQLWFVSFTGLVFYFLLVAVFFSYFWSFSLKNVGHSSSTSATISLKPKARLT